MRKLAGEMNPKGMRCDYCGVPTAATLEHIHPQAEGGRTGFDNIVLACPYCNTRKSTTDAEVFRQSGRWKMEYPERLPSTVEEMITDLFGWERGMPHLRTGSPHSRIKIIQDRVILEIRPGRRYPWEVLNLGATDNPAVVKATYDFLKRHFTPPKPKKYKNRSVWGERRPPV